MDTAKSIARWFIFGMGHVLGISPVLPRQVDMSPYDAIGGDFAAVGNDLRIVMARHPATADEAKALGVPAQLELAGIDH